MEKMEVHTRNKTYPIWVGENALEMIPEIFKDKLSDATKILVIADKHVSHLYKEKLKKHLPTHIPFAWKEVPQGEAAKSMAVFESCITEALEQNLDRKSCIIAFGGGAAGDLAGYVAASYMRGIRFLQVPTTILAHDSAVGGKVAINHPLGKNMIGHFHQPEAVIFDTNFINSLPEKEVRSGFAEVIKHALIKDKTFLHQLTSTLVSFEKMDSDFLEMCLCKGISIKADIVSEDETEQGIRAFLNFGHTYGHALEATIGYGRITHGEAVMIGIVYALYLSKKKYSLDLDLSSFVDWIKRLGYSLDVPDTISFNQLFSAMKRDKKTIGSSIRFVLLKEIGKPVIVEMNQEDLKEADQFIRSFSKL
ncbi:3-dehydroquinate synthase [Bacillus sp. FSL W8-0102]|uniref:3-dehydroquinate synthase n=1 Tax=Bacillus sp. FSL W8-0102 TaxID=2978205 RepID=UPI0030FC5015